MNTSGYLTKLEEGQARRKSVQFVWNNGEDWPDTLMHCCDAYYYDAYMVQQRVRAWGCSPKEAYDKAVTMWLEATGQDQ